jgi:hypothetical protein
VLVRRSELEAQVEEEEAAEPVLEAA